MKLFRLSHHHPSDCFCLGRKQKELCSMWSPEKWIWMETRMSRLEGKVRQGQWEATEEGKVGGLDRLGAAVGTSVNQHLLYGSGSWVLCWTHPFFLEEKMQFSPRAVFCQLNESGLLEPDYFLLMCLYFLFPRCFQKPQSSSLPESALTLHWLELCFLLENPVRQGVRGQPSGVKLWPWAWRPGSSVKLHVSSAAVLSRGSLPCYILNQSARFLSRTFHDLDTPARTFPQTHGTVPQSLFPREDSLASLLKQVWQV